MRGKLFFGLLAIILILAVLSGCTSTSTSTTTTTSQASTATSATKTTAPTSAGTSTTAPPATSAPSTTAPPAQVNWWDKDGTPQYGGTINLPTFRTGSLEGNFDLYNMMDFSAGWFDELFDYDWTLDRNVYSFQVGWVPDDYIRSSLAESWEWTDAQTLICYLQKGVLWQDKPPVNGREFTAYDVQYHFDRIMGTGSGFTEPSPSYMGVLSTVKNVEAIDKYTVVIHFINPTAVLNAWQIYDPVIQHFADPQEWVEQSDRTDWKNAVGTGPFVVTDFLAGTSMTLSRNPNYWGYDERHPQNKLPYADDVKIISIPDIATIVAAMRTGKIDMMMEVNPTQMDTLTKTNPDILRKPVPAWSESLAFRVDKGYFSDIRVRKAMEMAIDRQSIAQSLWGTDGKPCGAIPPIYKDYTLLYDDWPQDLKDEYSYNLTEAKKLMVEAGYPNGFKTDVIASGTNDMELLQIEKDMFKQIGVDMEIIVMEGPASMQYISARKHDAMSVAMGGVGTPPLMSIENASAQRNDAVCHNDQTYEAFVEKFRLSKDTEEAKKNAIEGVLYLLRQHWTTGPLPKTVYNVWQPYLKGYSGEGGPSYYGMRGWYYARFWIDQDLKK